MINENTAFLLLGSNMGDRLSFLSKATLSMQNKGIKITNTSLVYETEPWGVTDQQCYLNQVLKVNTNLTVFELLELVLMTETELGRERVQKWGSRTIDIDILYFNHDIIHTEKLKVPHPQLEKRRFTLVPLSEVDADYIHPVLGKSNRDLLVSCEDPLLAYEFPLLG